MRTCAIIILQDGKGEMVTVGENELTPEKVRKPHTVQMKYI